ncbi:MAG: tyrosinase [Solirubrobacteraceae bacterium]|jgi:tyrosinase|nr:tyrosinase [Solirubrobacteraceae bacterium]
MAVATAAGAQQRARIRHRRNVRTLTPGQLASFRKAIAASQEIGDDRGYQAWAGIHGLPLPISCTHNSELFLPWHRAYLYFFEKTLQDRVPGVTLPWWNWTTRHGDGLPPAYTSAKSADGTPNPLRVSPIQKSGREPGGPSKTTRAPGADGAPPLPALADVERVLALGDFLDFQSQLEDIHNGVHVWVGGTMGDIATAAYDPIFWAHHAMIDRIWRLWQLRHTGSRPPRALLGRALAPFGVTVRDTLSTTALGYDYAVTTSAAKGTG